ncbi:hypothetical protein AAE02nite_36130 [Adhaeribacter aerolatus]|uniref:Cytochrome c domain-containing protein n=1 Tax=Adhaeribacter aerolatus TaxID=670289 RepID=A0A512B1Y2_9BACT|nr:hypothetical protein [Adhaeribacter aerolatus]GEO05949.1 hypothetical protein AAE02nite_36130 [Adhaeribacter aerolatus]
MKKYLPGLLLLLVMACTNENEEELYGDKESTCQVTSATYLTDVKPILQRACYACHASNIQTAGVILDTYEGVKKQAQGDLLAVINHEPGHPPMPQGGAKLPACDIARIRKWVETGTLNN